MDTLLFDPGGVCVSPALLQLLDYDFDKVYELVREHSCGNFGNVDERDSKENASHAKNGFNKKGKVISKFVVSGWNVLVITFLPHGNTTTTVMLEAERGTRYNV